MSDEETRIAEGTASAAPPTHRYDLWKHLHDEYGLTLLESELGDIIQAVAQHERLLTREQVLPLVEALRAFVNTVDQHVNDGGGFPIPNTIELMANGHDALAHARNLGF